MSDSLRPHGLYSLPGPSVSEIFQARTLEWVTISVSQESSQPRIEPHLLHWQADSLLLIYQGSPMYIQKN